MLQPQQSEKLLSVKEIWNVFDKKISIRQIYNLIERGDLAPVYRLSGSRGTCVPREAVIRYKSRCVVEMGV